MFTEFDARMIVSIGLVGVSIVIGVGCLLWVQRVRKVGGVEPRCAACGYLVHGLPTPICPECGSNFARANGIVTARRLPRGRLVRSIAWSLFCLFAVGIPLGVAWKSFVMPALPSVRDESNTTTFVSPHSGAYRSIGVRAHAHYRAYPQDPKAPPNELRIELTLSNGKICERIVDPATLHFRDVSPPGSAMSSTPLDVGALVAWLTSAGVRGDAAQLNKEMALEMTQIRGILSSPPSTASSAGAEFYGIAGSSSGSDLALPWVDSVPLIVGAIVWGIGIVRILLSRPTPMHLA